MLLFGPINTDAPIYHWPKATLGLIIFQTVVFVTVACGVLGPEDDILRRFGLQYGDGLHPLQWVTSNFLHGDWSHLLGNCFILWGLGLVVEGKLGWRLFLAVFLGIGVIECALEQACLSGISGESFGSSAILFGLLAMALIWAPQNEITFGYVVLLPGMFRADTFDIPIQWFAVLEFAQEGALAWWHGFRPASELLHLAGGALGAGLGWSMLARGWVDCEGWDLASRFQKRKSSRAVPTDERRARQRTSAKRPNGSVDSGQARSLKRIREALREGRPNDAWDTLERMRHLTPEWTLPSADLAALAHALGSAGRWDESVQLLLEQVRWSSEPLAAVRIEAAEILINRLSRPQAAIKQLHLIDVDQLGHDLRAQYQTLRQTALRMIDDGVIEFDRGA